MQRLITYDIGLMLCVMHMRRSPIRILGIGVLAVLLGSHSVFGESTYFPALKASDGMCVSDPAPIPSLDGKLVFHVYSDYSAWDGKLFILDFADSSLTEISASWNIDHTINAHFSPDGTKLAMV